MKYPMRVKSMIGVQIKYDCHDIDFQQVAEILEAEGLSWSPALDHELAFKNSTKVIFALDKRTGGILGFSRVLSDGVLQAAVYDMVVNPRYHGKGIDKILVTEVITQFPDFNIVVHGSQSAT